jgi:hypothetical protein
MACSNNPSYEKELDKIKRKYSLDFLYSVENDEKKISNFFNFVIPSLASKHLDPKFNRWSCLFEECKKSNQSYASKQSLNRHLVTIHSNQIAASGSFLMPNSCYFNKKGYDCEKCEVTFKRYDHYKTHMSRHATDEDTVVLDENTQEGNLKKSFFFLIILKKFNESIKFKRENFIGPRMVSR